MNQLVYLEQGVGMKSKGKNKKLALSEMQIEYDNTRLSLKVCDDSKASFSHLYYLKINAKSLNGDVWSELSQTMKIACDKDYLTRMRDCLSQAINKMEVSL